MNIISSMGRKGKKGGEQQAALVRSVAYNRDLYAELLIIGEYEFRPFNDEQNYINAQYVSKFIAEHSDYLEYKAAFLEKNPDFRKQYIDRPKDE